MRFRADLGHQNLSADYKLDILLNGSDICAHDHNTGLMETR
jgi:hypothetical protein